MLKVLVVLPFYGGSLPIGRYCAEAFKEAECLVDTFESPSFFSFYSALEELRVSNNQLEFLQNSYLQAISQALLAKVEAFEPDLVFCMAQAPVSRQALKKLRKAGVATAMWFVEDYKLFPYWRAFAPYYDIFAVIQKEPFTQELASLGVTNSLYLPMAALPSLHRPIDLTEEEKSMYGSRVSFLGAGYPNRREAFLHLDKTSFKIWGNEWDGATELMPYVQRNGERIGSEEATKIYNATTININLHSSVEPNIFIGKGDFVNPRTFELAAAGAFQLVDKRGLMPELFAEDELACFSTLEELKEKIDYFLNRPEERSTVVEKSRARVLKEHQYVHRIKTFLEYASSVLPNLGNTSKNKTSMPKDLQQSLEKTVHELGIAHKASFDDIVTEVKKKKGDFSDIDISILFLDEWQKLYGVNK